MVVRQPSPSVEYDEFGKEFIGELEKELDMELDKSDDVRKRRPKGDAVDLLHLRLMMNDGRKLGRNQVMNLLSLGGFLFHYLEVKLRL